MKKSSKQRSDRETITIIANELFKQIQVMYAVINALKKKGLIDDQNINTELARAKYDQAKKSSGNQHHEPEESDETGSGEPEETPNNENNL